MNKYITFLTVAVISSFLLSYGTLSPLKSRISPKTIKKIDFHILPSQISSISKANQAEFNPALSDSFKIIYESKIGNLIPNDVVKGIFVSPDLVEKQSLYDELYNLISLVEKKRKINNIQVSSKLIDYYVNQNYEFVLVGFSSGFTREKGNYGKQVAKSLGVGLLTLGMFVPISYKANLTNIIFIIDVKNSNIVFYRRNTMELEPLKEKNIERRLKFILDSYFVPNQ